MRKKRLMVSVFGLTLLLSMALAGCGSGSSDGGSQTASGAHTAEYGESSGEDMVTITVWSNDAHNKVQYEEQIEKWNNGEGKEKGIFVEYQVYGSDYYSTLDVAIQAGEAPHIFKCNKIPQYAAAGHITALEDIPGGTEIAERYAQYNSVGLGIAGGKTYAVPFKETAKGLAWNKELFDSLGLTYPETFDEMRECARVITENGNGQIYGFALDMTYSNFALLHFLPMASASTGSMHFNNGTGEYQFSELLPFMEHQLDMINDGSVFPGFETLDNDTMRAQFAAGNIGMMPVLSTDVGVLTTQFPVDFEWAVGPYPSESADQKYKINSNPSNSYVINSKALEEGVEEEVMEVTKMLLSDDFLIKLYEEEKDLITLVDLREKATVADMSELWKEFGDSSYRHTGFGYPDGLLTLEGDTYQEAFNKILTGLADPAEALADLDERYNAALDKADADGVLNREDYIVENYADIVKY